MLSCHHLVCDTWLIWLLVDEFRQNYVNQKSLLPPLKKTYAEYVQWQTQLLASPQGEQLWAYWQQHLAGDLPVLNLPTDHPYPPLPNYQGKTYAFSLSPELTQGLNALTKAEGVTLYSLLLAAFQVLLHRYTGQNDILVGSPTTGRSQTYFANIVGYFVNQIVLRARFEKNAQLYPLFKSSA